jgi:hypothetical protein
MTQRTTWLAILVAAAFALPVAMQAAEPQKAATVISVKVTGDLQAYLGKIKTLQGINKRLGLPQARVWRETMGGEGSGTIHIVTEYPSLAAWVEGSGKLDADPEGSKLLRDLDASGIRTVLGRSLMVDETP